MEIKSGIADYSSPISGSGPRTQVTPVIFPTAVQTAVAGISGYSVSYADGDHHVGLIDIELSCTINDNVVLVNSTLGLRDWSGNWDDLYAGTIEFTVLADVAPVPPRPDLIVAGVETNQSVQFFRANSYLSPLSAIPDNAIPLSANKNTGLRVYPDWDAALGLPLAALTGSVTISGSTVLLPLNPGQAITPHADDTTNIGVIEDTLNFMIPAALCSGQLTIDVVLWDQANPGSKSAHFTRTLLFTPLPTLNIFVVGINYTAQSLNLAAPTQAAFTAAGYTYLQEVYPMGTITQTGYSTLAFGENVNFTIGTQGGCGQGFNDLLTQLTDLKGGSGDIYVGVLPPLAQIQPAGSNIGGCAPTGGGVAAVFIDQTFDVPHEVGHALGRSHAPCTPGICNPPPANVDPNYPQYGAFPAGSIGVFGFDPVGYRVLNPASTFDTMAYRFPQWISVYTYLALSGAAHSTEGGTGAGISAHATTDVPIDTLFLSLAVNRDRSVRRNVCFHFPATPRAQSHCNEFVVELLDVDREVLVCVPVSCDCDDVGHHCWPKHLRGAIPYPEDSRWLLVWEGERKLHEEWIPRPPKVTIEGIETTDAGKTLIWSGHREGDYDDACCCTLWYLVQWFDPEYEVWRGVAPRTRAERLLLPPSLLHHYGTLQLRVLASCGIATGMAEYEVQGKGDGQGNNPPPPQPNLTLVTQRRGEQLGNLITATPISVTGRHVSTSKEVWVVQGREVAKGPTLDLRSLKQGESVVRVFLQAGEAGHLSKSWTVQRKGDSFTLVAEGEHHVHTEMEPHIHPHPAP
jgi:hypothetical protein